ncbi:MAG: MATE family efflux transporter [Candidatus Kapaibacteriota bacterium]
MISRSSSVDLLNDPIDRSLRQFAVPMAFSFMINMIYSLIDRYYASRLGDDAIAAIGASDQVTFFVFTLASGFAVGTGIIVARRFGERELDEAGRIAAQALVAMVLIGSVITAVIYGLLPSVPRLMNMPPIVGGMAMQYMQMLYLGFTANLVNFQLFSVIRSTGNPVFPMMVLISTTVLNAVIAPLLIFGVGPFPAMGLAGAGLATAIAQASGTVLALWAILTGKTGLGLRFQKFRLDGQLILRVAKLGVPASLQMLSVSVNRALIFVLVGGYGTSITAAYTLGLNVDMAVFMCVFALGVSVEVATGQNIGAGNWSRALAYHRSAVKQGGALMLLLGVAVLAFGALFVELYTQQPATIAAATTYLQIAVIGYVFFAIGLVTVRSISGAGAAFTSLTITASSLLGFQLPAAYIFSRFVYHGPTGVWVGIVLGYAVFAAAALLVHRRPFWRTASV